MVDQAALLLPDMLLQENLNIQTQMSFRGTLTARISIGHADQIGILKTTKRKCFVEHPEKAGCGHRLISFPDCENKSSLPTDRRGLGGGGNGNSSILTCPLV